MSQDKKKSILMSVCDCPFEKVCCRHSFFLCGISVRAPPSRMSLSFYVALFRMFTSSEFLNKDGADIRFGLQDARKVFF